MESDEPSKSKISEELETQHLIDEYSVSEDAYSRIVMDQTDKFCKEQVEQRKLMLDEKYGTKKGGINVVNKK